MDQRSQGNDVLISFAKLQHLKIIITIIHRLQRVLTNTLPLCHLELSREISPCATLSRDDKGEVLRGGGAGGAEEVEDEGDLFGGERFWAWRHAAFMESVGELFVASDPELQVTESSFLCLTLREIHKGKFWFAIRSDFIHNSLCSLNLKYNILYLCSECNENTKLSL